MNIPFWLTFRKISHKITNISKFSEPFSFNIVNHLATAIASAILENTKQQ